MKAVVMRTFGAPEVLRLEEVPRPEPGERDILVRNRATAVTAAECAARKGEGFARLAFGPVKPRYPILGGTFAGEVVEVGSAVTRFAVGDEVFGDVGGQFGALAELVKVPDAAAVRVKPENLSFERAVAVFDGSFTALPFLRDWAKLRPGQSILINGASGAVGTAAVQLAKHFGAVVTAVCSAPNVELVRSLGADQVIDYTTEDFTRSGQEFDVVFDAIGKSSYRDCKRLLKPSGRYLTTVPSLRILMRTLLTSRERGRSGSIGFAGLRKAADVAKDLDYIAGLAASGKYVPVIDRTYPLEQTAEAHRYVDTERKRGSVVIEIGQRS